MPLEPQTGPDGQVIPHDDPNIDPESFLVRNINIEEHVFWDENRRIRRIKSAAFGRTNGDPNYGMSVVIGQLLAEQNKALDTKVPKGMGAVKFVVKDVRSVDGLLVGSDPEPDNECHGQIWGVRDSKRTKLQKLVADWVVQIPDVALR